MDGLKPSQRKILYASLKRGLKEEIRVAQLAGYVSEHAAYHHGEASLNGTIVGMGQNFVGSNNINLFKPIGQFGCLAPDTPILMWNGTIKFAEQILIGDQLIGDNGQIRTVTQTTNGIDNMYQITDKHNIQFAVNSQHILTLQYNDNFEIKWKESHSAWYFNYFNGTTIKCVSVVTSELDVKDKHYNTAKINKEQGYFKIQTACIALKVQHDSSKLIDIKLQDYLALSVFSKRGLYMVSNLNCIQWEAQSVPIDPYILGAWLGDGDSAGKGFTSADEEIIKSFVTYLKKIGGEVTHHTNSNHDGYHYSIKRSGTGHLPAIGSGKTSKQSCIGCTSSNIEITHNTCDWICDYEPEESEINKELCAQCNKFRLNPFTQLLRNTNLFKNKHIPTTYMINDKKTRLQLLAGFIDTDGTIRQNNTSTVFIEISQSKRLHENLIYAIDFIAKSLGYATSIYTSKHQTTSKGEDMCLLTIRIMGNNLDEIPTRIKRKQIVYSQERQKKTIHFTRFNVNYIGKNKFCGWSIDGNERFLLGNFVVTHNSRLLGGQDAASPRYIHTCLEDIVAKLFRKEDACLLKHVDDDGDVVEPEYYLPVLPLLAINGSVGIGTGYSTNVPPHKPDEIACLLRKRLDGSMDSLAGHPLDPWWFGFKGPVGRVDEQTWYTKGIYDLDDAKRTVTITELPVGTWTKNYKEFLDTLCEEDEKKSKEAKKEAKKAETASASSTRSTGKEVEPCGLKGFDDLYNDVDVRFILYFTEEGYDAIKDAPEKFEKQFKLISTWKTTNMTCFDTDFNIVRYKTVGDIMEAFMEKRLPMYEARRLSQLETLTKQITELDAKRRFIQAILDERLILQKKTDEEIVVGLQACNIPPLSNPDYPSVYDSYEYVLKMRIDRLKLAAVIELDKQIAEKQGEIDYLAAQTGASLWIQDLDEFHEAWITYAASREAESVPAGVRADAPKKKIAPLKKIAKK